MSGSVEPAALKVHSSSVQLASACATGARLGGGASGSRWTHTLATAPLNWSVALAMTAPDGETLPPMLAGWVDGKVSVPAEPFATVVVGAAVLPYCLSGGTDNKAFSKLGIKGYGFAPLQLPAGLDFAGMFHGVDERVPLEALRFGVRAFDRFLALS